MLETVKEYAEIFTIIGVGIALYVALSANIYRLEDRLEKRMEKADDRFYTLLEKFHTLDKSINKICCDE